MKRFNTAHGTEIAYQRLSGRGPGIVYLGGFRSDMEGSKALHLQSFCQAQQLPYVRFDYYGHGASSGRFEEGSLSLWLQDTLAVIDALTEGPQILVGSSMGAWLMVLAALRRSERIQALVGIGAAPDFTQEFSRLSPEHQADLKNKGFCLLASGYEEPYVITQAMIEDSQQYYVLGAAIPIDCPVRLLHGLNDVVVPWQQSLKLSTQLRSEQVEVLLFKHGDHSLSTAAPLAALETLLHTWTQETI